jgi:hypothetical protein
MSWQCYEIVLEKISKKFVQIREEKFNCRKKLLEQVDRDGLLSVACESRQHREHYGRGENVAKYLGSQFEKLGMQVEYQYVEDGRPNVVGTLKGPAAARP